MINLSSAFNEGMTNLRNWRIRYTPKEYPEKIALNLFYRRYAMQFMWPDIENFISAKQYDDFGDALLAIERVYSQIATSKVHPILLSLLKNNPTNPVGGINYAHYLEMISKIHAGDKKTKEELEFAYLYYLLSDKATLCWAALCATGVDKNLAIGILSGVLTMPQPINDYTTINSAMGQLCAARYLHDHYVPLP